MASDDCSNALLSLHAITGTDTTGKFDGKSKEFWFRRFLSLEVGDKSLVDELTQFQESPEENTAIESFICRGYLYKSIKEAGRRIGESNELNSCRYSLFTKKQLEGEKLPPTKGTFRNHLPRAFFQLYIWSSAYLFTVEPKDPCSYGWNEEDGQFVAAMSDTDIAPNEVVDLVACRCKGDLCFILI